MNAWQLNFIKTHFIIYLRAHVLCAEYVEWCLRATLC